jgi:serine/threonine protein kinase/Tol biopolymer transport system component
MNAHPEQIGPYPIERELGRGGMGIVYLGRDTKLDRPVAIKVLPDLVTDDADRLARFEREARLLASLNHPNIAGIYGIEESEGNRFLALEFVDGPTLAERLDRGALPVDESINVAFQIACALEAAHENGVIHRDLKPGNVKLAPTGEVKVLDFGLAKGAATSGDSDSNLSHSPTLTLAGTGVGVILGTAAYMSPEQARGKPVDRRTDIWSFGCVLYECLTGRQLFAGETASDIIAKILEREPDWEALPARTPEKVRQLIRRCLEKDPKRRLRDIGEARIELEDVEAARTSSIRTVATDATSSEVRPARRAGAIPWVIAAVAIAVAAASLLSSGLFKRSTDAPLVRFQVTPERGITILPTGPELAISPDGRMLVYGAADSTGSYLLWIRPLDSLEATPLAGTNEAYLPFWSPDSRTIGFFATDKLHTISLDGGSVETLCDGIGGRGGSWNRDDIIIFGVGAGPIYKVPASGGTPEAITALDSTRKETAHRFPFFLPDGKRFLFVTLPMQLGQHDVFIGDLDASQPAHLMSAQSGVIYAEPGYLLYQRGANIVAQLFEAGAASVTGEPWVIGAAPQRPDYTGANVVCASESGQLAYLSAQDLNTRIAWFDRQGREVGSIAVAEGIYDGPSLSPDGRLLALERKTAPGESDIWLVELDRVVANRFTFGPGENRIPLWTPDGQSVVFQSNRNGPWDIFIKPVDGSTPEQPILTSDATFKHPTSIAPDGRHLLFDQLRSGGGMDIWVLPLEGDREPLPYVVTSYYEGDGKISPDGRWAAFASQESGTIEIYVTSFLTPGRKYRISTNGGNRPQWRGDGREIIYLGVDGRTVMSVPIETEPQLRAGTPRPLFRSPAGTVAGVATPDTQRFLYAISESAGEQVSLTVIMNWLSLVE